jgi:hypothetical protein
MSDFNSFRNAVLENDDLQDEVMSVVMTATRNGSDMGDGIATLAKNHGYTITSEEVYAHADFLGQDGDLTDFELELISGGQTSQSGS